MRNEENNKDIGAALTDEDLSKVSGGSELPKCKKCKSNNYGFEQLPNKEVRMICKDCGNKY